MAKEYLSKCCNSLARVHSEEEGTNYYICNSCQRPCDPDFPNPETGPNSFAYKANNRADDYDKKLNGLEELKKEYKENCKVGMIKKDFGKFWIVKNGCAYLSQDKILRWIHKNFDPKR